MHGHNGQFTHTPFSQFQGLLDGEQSEGRTRSPAHRVSDNFRCGRASFSVDLRASFAHVQQGSELRGGTGSGAHASGVEGALICSAQGHHTRIDQQATGKVFAELL